MDNYDGDVVSIFGVTEMSMVRTFKGAIIPPPIVIAESTVVVEFFTDHLRGDSGWKIIWKTYELGKII